MPTINKRPKKQFTNKSQEAYRKRRKIYNTKRWQRMRDAKLMEQPLCYVCQLEGKTVLASQIHHLRTFTQEDDENKMNALAYDSNNLVALCYHHHYCIHHSWLKGATSIEEIEQYTKAHLEEEEEKEKDNSKKQLNSFIF